MHHGDSLGVVFNDNFRAGAHAGQERREVAGSFRFRDVNDLVSHVYEYTARVAPTSLFDADDWAGWRRAKFCDRGGGGGMMRSAGYKLHQTEDRRALGFAPDASPQVFESLFPVDAHSRR